MHLARTPQRAWMAWRKWCNRNGSNVYHTGIYIISLFPLRPYDTWLRSYWTLNQLFRVYTSTNSIWQNFPQIRFCKTYDWVKVKPFSFLNVWNGIHSRNWMEHTPGIFHHPKLQSTGELHNFPPGCQYRTPLLQGHILLQQQSRGLTRESIREKHPHFLRLYPHLEVWALYFAIERDCYSFFSY